MTAPGSTLHISTPATLVFDTGSKFTAGLLREGTDAIDAFTLTLAHPDDPDPNAILDDHEALRAYTDRITDHAVNLWDVHFPGKPLRIVIEAARRPRRGRAGGMVRIPIRDWVIPQRIMSALTTCFSGAVILEPQHAGGRHKVANGGTGNPRDYYPTSLIGARPRGWDVNEATRGTRDHEQAAYTLAGLAELAQRGDVA